MKTMKLERLSEGMKKSTTPRGVITVHLFSEKIFAWVKQKHRDRSFPPMTEYVLAECEKQIKEIEVWIPISLLYIQSPFRLGRVNFRAITKRIVDDYEARINEKITKPKALDAAKQFIDRMRREIQGLAAATIEVEAEPRRAYEIAEEESEKAMNVLRFFSPANFHPGKTCYSAPWCKQHEDLNRYLSFQDGKIVGHASGFTDKSAHHWNLTREELQMFQGAGLNVLSDLLRADKLTDFQKSLIEALSLYSRSSLAKQPSDKLVYILVSLESVFLKDSSELIQDAISLRMSYMLPLSVEERRAMISNVRAAYALRSSFIHHGLNVSLNDRKTLEEFMKNSWMSLQALFPLAASQVTKKEFFKSLEDRKLAG